MVSISPRLRDSLDFEDPENVDPRFSWGFRSLTLDSSGYEEHDLADDGRPFASSPDPSGARRRRRQRQSDTGLVQVEPHEYQTVADGHLFRLAVLKPGTGVQPIDIDLIWEDARAPKREYKCLSYCWQTNIQDAAILVDSYRFEVTSNLLKALQSLRKRNAKVLIWVDQICINQNDFAERGHQVSIMKDIFRQAKQVVVHLGEFQGSEKLCEYAKKYKRGDSEGIRSMLKRILPPRQLGSAIQKMLETPWFTRVWVISEVCLATLIRISCGSDAYMSWENLVGLVRDFMPPQTPGFAKQSDLLGNTRQRVAIITQMMANEKDGLAHADISQLLILAKSSKATDHRDKVYAFYGMTLLSTTPDYTRSVESLFVEIARDYVNSIEACYASWKDLTDSSRTFQLTSIIYSAGSLHQHYPLPSWVPDWTHAWYLAPLWAKTSANIMSASSRNAWTAGIRSDYRAGGESDRRDHFEIIERSTGALELRLSAIIVDSIVLASENTPVSTPAATAIDNIGPATPKSASVENLVATGTMRYGRAYFKTSSGHTGLGTPGIEAGDVVAILLGGDVPVVLRPIEPKAEMKTRSKTLARKAANGRLQYQLLCECFVENHAVMYGDVAREDWTSAEDIVLV